MAIQTVNQATEEQNLNLHAACRDAAEHGFSRNLTLHAHEVQRLSARLRGVVAISALLTADSIQFDIGDWLRGGLSEAVRALAEDARDVLEEVDHQARQKEMKAAA